MITQSSIQNVVGRVVEIFVREREVSDVQIAAFQGQLARAVQGAVQHGGQLVVIADMRGLTVAGPKLADYIIQVMRSDNKHLLRSALLCEPNATFGLQVERVIRESGHTERKRFTKVVEATGYLSEVLLPDEMQRVEQFLANGPVRS